MWKRLSVFDKIWLGLIAVVLLGLSWVGIPHFCSACLLSRSVRALNAEGNTQAAIRHFESAVGVEPGNTQAFRKLAQAYLKVGDSKKAIEHYEAWDRVGYRADLRSTLFGQYLLSGDGESASGEKIGFASLGTGGVD